MKDAKHNIVPDTNDSPQASSPVQEVDQDLHERFTAVLRRIRANHEEVERALASNFGDDYSSGDNNTTREEEIDNENDWVTEEETDDDGSDTSWVTDPEADTGMFLPGSFPVEDEEDEGSIHSDEIYIAGQRLISIHPDGEYEDDEEDDEEDGVMRRFFGRRFELTETSSYDMDQVIHLLYQSYNGGGGLGDDVPGSNVTPASSATIEKLEKRLLAQGDPDEQSECIICQETFGVKTELIRMPCKHEYHGSCIRQWLGVSGTCPMCRCSVLSEEDQQKTDDTDNESQPESDDEAGVYTIDPEWATRRSLPVLCPLRHFVNSYSENRGGGSSRYSRESPENIQPNPMDELD
ncbi:hypothetical protein DFQ30_006058 [Apophysomyces sp. BC1015]|nr:hypothetical protein DFQ30_006058 [Apophysomyces sp. BC1015]